MKEVKCPICDTLNPDIELHSFCRECGYDFCYSVSEQINEYIKTKNEDCKKRYEARKEA